MARLELELDGSRLKSGAEQAETSLEGVKRGADRAEKSLDRLGAEGAKDMQRLGAETRKTTAAQEALTNATRRQGSAFSRNRGQIQNASFQIGDFATQVGAGTAASVALGQQLPQLLGGFGALGAVLGAVVAIGVPLAASFLRSGDAAQSAGEAVSDYADAIDTLKRANDLVKGSLEDVRSQLAGTNEELRRFLDISQQIALQGISSDRASAVSAISEQFGGDLEALATQLELLQRAEEQMASIGDTTSVAFAAASDSATIAREIFQGISDDIGATGDQARELIKDYQALADAKGPREVAQAAEDLAEELLALNNIEFAPLLASLRDLAENARRELRETAEAAVSTNSTLASIAAGGGRGAAGPGGPGLDSIDAQLLRQGITPSAANDNISASTSKATGEVKKLNDAIKNTKPALTDAEKASLAFKEQLEDFQDLDKFVIKSGEALQQSLSDFLFDPFQTGVRGMVLQFSDALRRMASDAIAAQITQSIFGALGGFGGGSASPIPLYDSGGYIPSGQAGMVAEKRPEVVNGSAVDMPSIVRGPARVQGGASTARNGTAAPVANIKNVIALNTSDLAAAVVSDPQFEARVTELRVRDAS